MGEIIRIPGDFWKNFKSRLKIRSDIIPSDNFVPHQWTAFPASTSLTAVWAVLFDSTHQAEFLDVTNAHWRLYTKSQPTTISERYQFSASKIFLFCDSKQISNFEMKFCVSWNSRGGQIKGANWWCGFSKIVRTFLQCSDVLRLGKTRSSD